MFYLIRKIVLELLQILSTTKQFVTITTMKKLMILLFLNLVIQMPLLSDTISVDSVKATAIIFNDHARLEKENSLLLRKIGSLEDLNKLYVQSDSIKDSEIELYKEKSNKDERKITRLKKSRKLIGIGSGIGGILLFILGILI